MIPCNASTRILPGMEQTVVTKKTDVYGGTNMH